MILTALQLSFVVATGMVNTAVFAAHAIDQIYPYSSLIHHRFAKCTALSSSKATGRVVALHECHRVAKASTPSTNVTILSSRDMAYGCILHNSVIHQGRSIITAAYYNIDMFSDKNCSVYDVCICSKLHHGNCHAPKAGAKPAHLVDSNSSNLLIKRGNNIVVKDI